MGRHRARQVQQAEDDHVLAHDLLAGLGQLAVAARLGGQIDDHRPGSHPADGRGGDELRRGTARNQRCRDDDVELRDPLLERLLLARLFLRRQLARVAALGLLADHTEVEERRAQ